MGTTLTQVSSSQAQKEVTANENFTAVAAAGLFGRRAVGISGLTWAYFGGTLYTDGVAAEIADGTVSLTNAATNYIEATRAGVVSANTTGFTAGRMPLYTAVTAGSVITSYVDKRAWGERFQRSRVSIAVGGGAGTTVLTRDQAACDIIEFTGVLTGNRTIEVPAVPWPWIVYNNTSGAFTLTVKTNAGTGIAVPQGKRQVLYCDGTDVVDALSSVSALDVAGALGVGGNATVTGTLTVNGTGTSSIAGLLDLSGASAGQIKFPATQNASSNANTLDDYEEGSWTVGFTFATAGDLAFSSETKEGYYVKVGQVILAYCHYTFTPTWTTSSGAASMTGLPYAQKNVTNQHCVGRGLLRHNAAITYTAGNTSVHVSVDDSATVVDFCEQGSATAASSLTVSNFATGVSTQAHFSVTYQAGA